MTERVSPAEVMELMARLFAEQGQQAAGLLNPGRPDSALERPWASWAGEDLFPSLEAKAAALLHGVVSGHPFADGNKRAGLVAALLFLRKNRNSASADQAELYELTIAIASGQLHDVGVIAERLAELFGLDADA